MNSEELREYVDAFKVSSDRVRHVLFVVIIVTTLMAIANNNTKRDSWPLRRLDTYYQLMQDAATEEKVEPERLKLLREEYHKQFVAHAVGMSSPIPGVWIDANDLGTIGGLVLVLLMLTLLFCLAREHENLYLALFRVRTLCEKDDHAKGDSEANLLYHALAMRQALSFPPTLARWRKVISPFVVAAVFFAPAIADSWIVGTNYYAVRDHPEMGPTFGVDVAGLVRFQIWVSIALWVLSLWACLYSLSMARRWKRAFYRINPHRRPAPQMSMREWLTLGWKRDHKATRLASYLVDTLDVEPEESTSTVEVSEHIEHVNSSRIGTRVRDQMVKRLLEAGKVAARDKCAEESREFKNLLKFERTSNKFAGSSWNVSGTWTFHCQSPNTSGKRGT